MVGNARPLVKLTEIEPVGPWLDNDPIAILYHTVLFFFLL